MANDLRGNPWLIDTPSATVIHIDVAHIDSFVFSEYLNAADQCVIQDWRGRDIVRMVGNNDLTPVQYPPGGDSHMQIRGLVIPTLSSGVVAVNLR